MSARRFLSTPLVSTATSIAQYSRVNAMDITVGAPNSVLVTKGANSTPTFEVDVTIPTLNSTNLNATLLNIGGEPMYNTRFSGNVNMTIGASTVTPSVPVRIFRSGKVITYVFNGVTLPAGHSYSGSWFIPIPVNYRAEVGETAQVLTGVTVGGVLGQCKIFTLGASGESIGIALPSGTVVPGTEYILQPFTITYGNNVLA